MGLFKDTFNRNTQSKASNKKALEVLNKKKNKRAPVTTVVPKTMKDKVEYAKMMSTKIFSDRLDRMELVTSEERINQYLDKVLDNGILAVDTETNGLDRIDGKIAGICLYTPGEKGIYIPIGHVSYMTNMELKDNVSKEFMRNFFEVCNRENIKYVLHNSKYDMHILYWMIGVKIVPYWDTLIGGYLLNENEPHGLKALWQKYCTGESAEVGKFSELFNGIEFNKIPPDVGYMYASFDPIMTYELYEFQYDYLDRDGKHCYRKGLERVADVFRNIEMPLIEVVFDMEAQGVDIDIDLAHQLKERYTTYMDNALNEFNTQVAELDKQGVFNDLQVKHPDKYSKISEFGEVKINIGSNQQLVILFYDVLKLEPPKGQRSVGEEQLKQLNHPLVSSILEYRSMSKLLSTYIDAIPDHISKRTGKLHANFNQYGAKCIVGNSIIPTTTGYKRIDEMCSKCVDDDTFYEVDNYICNKDGVAELSNAVIRYSQVPTIKITLTNGYTIEGTPNHPIIKSIHTKESFKRNTSAKRLRTMWDDNYFEQLQNIKEGDIIPIPLNNNINSAYYQPLNVILNYNTSSKQITMPNVINEDLALLLGMYHADGTIGDANGSYSIEIHNCDKDVRATVHYLAKQLFNITCYEWVSKNNPNEVSNYITSINLKQLDYLFSRGAKYKKIPQVIYNSPNSVINNYIKGMTLDSSVYKDGKSLRFRMTIANETDATFIQTHLASIGIVCSRRIGGKYTDGTPFWELAFNGSQYLLFRDTIGFVETSKYRNDAAYKSNKTVIINNCFKGYVEKIEYGVADVYDIHVPQTHSFIANGYISHNTGRFSSSDPNLQNIPSKTKKLSDGTVIDAGHDIRQMFIAGEGNVIIGGDFS